MRGERTKWEAGDEVGGKEENGGLRRKCVREGKRREYRGNNNETVRRKYEGRDGRE